MLNALPTPNQPPTRLLVGALIALPEDLGNALLVLSLLPAPFTYEAAAQVLAHPVSSVQRRGLLRRLVALGLLVWTPGRRLYGLPAAVRDATLVLTSTLGAWFRGRFGCDGW